MSNEFTEGLITGLFIGAICVVVTAIFIVQLREPSVTEQHIVDMGYGYYHYQTTEFNWFTEKEIAQRNATRPHSANFGRVKDATTGE